MRGNSYDSAAGGFLSPGLWDEATLLLLRLRCCYLIFCCIRCSGAVCDIQRVGSDAKVHRQ